MIGYDIVHQKVKELQRGVSRIEGLEERKLSHPHLSFTSKPGDLKKCDFVIVAVPTPVTKTKFPDLRPVLKASETVGRNLKKGALVVYESTVYPGVTEDLCLPVLEKCSKLKCGKGFFLGYSPERINPGDEAHSLENVVKVVSGQNASVAKRVAALYSKIVKSGVFPAASIRVAEAAKVIENTQRDINIGLMNELSLIFEKMGLSTRDVLAAASTKWNFLKFYPGLVGGHCISVDPYYLTYAAQKLGHHSKVILAGREVNDFMPEHVALQTVGALNEAGKPAKGAKVLVLGLSFKENIADYRNSGSKKIIQFLKEWGADVKAFDPHVQEKFLFGVPNLPDLDGVKNLDALVIATPHQAFRELSLAALKRKMGKKPVLVDVRWLFPKKEAESKGFIYRSL